MRAHVPTSANMTDKRPTSFWKMHGLGNDFVIIDGRTDAVALSNADIRALADRHTGIGCDQLILLERSTLADLRMRIYNADGSEAGACGNATRAIARLLDADLRIETSGGLLHARAQGRGADVDMGTPRFGWQDIPLAYAMDTQAMPVGWGDLATPFAVNVGNPHIVFFVDDADAIALGEIGPVIEHDPLFPERVNVNIAQITGAASIRLRVWERGAGLTRACGTGACASAVAAMTMHKLASPCRVSLPGGELDIAWTPGGSIRMSGPATRVFQGSIDASWWAEP